MTPRAIILLLLAIATLFAAANVGVGWLYALGFLFLSYFLLAFGLAVMSLWGLRATLRPAERTVVGEGLSCTVALEHSGHTARGFLSLLAPPLGARRGVGPFRGYLVPEGWGHAFVLEVRPGDRALVAVAFPASRRGEFRLPPLVVQAPAYGLGAVHLTVRTEATVLVRPRLVELPRLPWFQGNMMAEIEDRSAVPSAGYELIRTIREYRPGDPMKSVHWRSTARTGELRIKETEGEASAGGVAIALDLGEGHTAESYEHAIVVAASLCAYAHGQGIAVTLCSQGGEPADQSLEGQLDWLARLQRRTPTPPPSSKGGKIMAGGRARWLDLSWISRRARGSLAGRVPGRAPDARVSGVAPDARVSGVAPDARVSGVAPDARVSGLARVPPVSGVAPDSPYNGFPPFEEGGARGGPPYSLLISPDASNRGPNARVIHVGSGAAPAGAIACPVGCDLPQALGGSHGA